MHYDFSILGWEKSIIFSTFLHVWWQRPKCVAEIGERNKKKITQTVSHSSKKKKKFSKEPDYTVKNTHETQNVIKKPILFSYEFSAFVLLYIFVFIMDEAIIQVFFY
jgi:hypothetical protein